MRNKSKAPPTEPKRYGTRQRKSVERLEHWQRCLVVTDETPRDGEMTLVTQRASFGSSWDDDPVSNDRTLSILTDSGSNINIIQQKDIRFWDIPETYENKPGRLNDIGTLPTLGVIGLRIPLEKMIDGIMKPHVHVYTCEDLLIHDDTGPKCTLVSSVQSSLNRWDTHGNHQGHYAPEMGKPKNCPRNVKDKVVHK